MFFYYSNDPNRPTVPLSTKLTIWGIVLLAFVLLFVFGFTFFLIALAGGVLTFLANLFGIRRPGSTDSAPGPYSPPSSSSRKRRDEDDVIDV